MVTLNSALCMYIMLCHTLRSLLGFVSIGGIYYEAFLRLCTINFNTFIFQLRQRNSLPRVCFLFCAFVKKIGAVGMPNTLNVLTSCTSLIPSMS